MNLFLHRYASDVYDMHNILKNCGTSYPEGGKKKKKKKKKIKHKKKTRR